MREKFERLIRADGYFTSLNRHGDRYVVAELQATWEGYQMRQPEIDALTKERDLFRALIALKAENERLHKLLKVMDT